MPRSINWKICGAAGAGIKSTGEIMAKVLVNSGYKVFGYTEYPSLIRGGHNTYQVWADESGAFSQRKYLDVLVALNQETIDAHRDELTEKTVVIADESLDVSQIKATPLKLPIDAKVTELGEPLIKNTLTLGITAAELGLKKEIFLDLIQKIFGDKTNLININNKAFEAGFMMHPNPKIDVISGEANKGYLITGNEAIALGAIKAGLQLFAGYPMTPVTRVMEFLAEHQEKFNYIVHHSEDEIAAINMVVGAAYTGAKAMTATSGGGFDLMQEGFSFAGILEVPLVINLGMRPGPATGMPTWTSQGDLRLAIHAGHGEFPRIVLTPGDAVEAYELTHEAFFLAQKYQVPVIILSDKHLNESHFFVENLSEKKTVPLMNIDFKPKLIGDEMYHRYQTEAEKIASRTLPGIEDGFYIANSDEHNAEGLSSESGEDREMMNRRRKLKLERIKADMGSAHLFGETKAKLTLVGFGSTKGAILEALKELKEVNYIHLTHIWPLNEEVKNLFKDKKLIVIENNQTAQLAGLIKEQTGIEAFGLILKDDGRPFYPEEISEAIKKYL